MNREPIKFPSQVLREEEAAVSTTASMATSDKPLGKKLLRRKPEMVGVSEIPTDSLGEAVLGNGTGKPRHTLPQITNWEGFVAAVRKAGGDIEDEDVDTDSLTATQSNFNQEKVDRIVADGVDDLLAAKPVVVSKDDFILDGHHRWLAAKELGIDLPVRRVSLDIEELHTLCKGADFVEKRTLDESTHEIEAK